jgi:large subunit ribosomal protein L18
MAKTRLERKNPRARTKMRTRRKLLGSDERPRICVFRSSKHIYAQVISDSTGITLASASTLDKEVASVISSADKASTKSVVAAKAVGALVAKRALGQNVKQVKFDRNGFVYTGRIKAVADGAREAGLDF